MDLNCFTTYEMLSNYSLNKVITSCLYISVCAEICVLNKNKLCMSFGILVDLINRNLYALLLLNYMQTVCNADLQKFTS